MPHLRQFLLPLVVLGASLAAAPAVLAEDPFDEINRRFQSREQASDDALREVHTQYQAKRAAMDSLWRQREQEIEARWQALKQAVEQKWPQAERSTPTTWTDYGSAYEAKSAVNFEQGTVEVTALVPAAEAQSLLPPAPFGFFAASPRDHRLAGHRAFLWRVALPSAPADWADALRLAALPASWGRIVRQFEQAFGHEARTGQPVLAGQVATRAGKPVDASTVKAFVQEDVLPAAVADPQPVDSRDGVQRIKVTVRVTMTPDHIKRRAQQYQDLVPFYAKQQGVDPRLLYALIHSESYFNPRAQSPLPTYGLMQLVPRGAARDAYNVLYKDDRVLDDAYLLDPAHNVELGAAYLRLLRKQLFVGMDEGPKQNYLLATAFKWGPGNVQHKILKQVRVQDLTETQVFTMLTQRTPDDTRTYLRQVRDRLPLYEELAATLAPPPERPQP